MKDVAKIQKEDLSIYNHLEHRTVTELLDSVPTMPHCPQYNSVQISKNLYKVSYLYTIPSVETMGLKAPDFFRPCPAHTMAFFAHEALLLHESFQGVLSPSLVSQRFSCLHIHLTKQKMGKRWAKDARIKDVVSMFDTHHPIFAPPIP